MYSVAGYGKMIADPIRVAAYTEALRRAITPGCAVLEIGTGTGFFAMLACRLGARKVYAVEPDDVIRLAQAAAQANGFGDRIEFIQDLSTRINLPEQVDVVVSDLRTVLPWFQHHVATIVDARTRLLKPDGILIPERDTLWAAMVELPEFYAQTVGHLPADTAGFDMSVARRVGANAWAKARARPEHLLTEAHEWAVLDFHRVSDPATLARLDWTAARSGTAHGVLAWFDTLLLDEIGFSNAPAAPPVLYGQAFFPMQEPVSIAPDDVITVQLNADLVDDDYVWRWKTHIAASDGATKADFSQNSLDPVALDTLRRGSASHVPVLSGRARIDRFILDRMDGTAPLAVIAEAVARDFPEDYPTCMQALEAVATLSLRYSR